MFIVFVAKMVPVRIQPLLIQIAAMLRDIFIAAVVPRRPGMDQ